MEIILTSKFFSRLLCNYIHKSTSIFSYLCPALVELISVFGQSILKYEVMVRKAEQSLLFGSVNEIMLKQNK